MESNESVKRAHLGPVDHTTIAGKTITAVIEGGSDDGDCLLLSFSDGSYAVIDTYASDDAAVIYSGGLNLWYFQESAEKLLELDVVTQAEYDRWRRKVEDQAAKRAEQERKDYERLKAKFEGLSNER
jgi:hypothetical protein